MKFPIFYNCLHLLIWVDIILIGIIATNVDSEIDNLLEFFRKNPIEDHEQSDKIRHMHAAYWRDLGALYQLKSLENFIGHELNYYEQKALDAFSNSIEINDNYDISLAVDTWQRKGLTNELIGLADEAIYCQDVAYNLAQSDHDKATSLHNKGNALVMVGRVSEAIELYLKAIKLSPGSHTFYHSLVKAYAERGTSVEIWRAVAKDIERLTNPSAFSVNPSPGVHWAGFTVYDYLNETMTATRHLLLAHQLELVNRQSPFMTRPQQGLAETKSVFTKSFFRDLALGSKIKTPIFIVGMMRSGSTLLETMLDAHSEVWGLGEGSIFNHGLKGFRNKLLAPGASYADVINSYAKNVSKEMLNIANEHLRRDQRRKAANQNNINPNYSPKVKIKYVSDKMLFNFKNIGFIHLVFPNAVILHTIRDPLDTLFSCLKSKFDHGGLEWAMDADALVDQYVAYLETMQHFRDILPGRVKDISYEGLVEDPETVMRGVLKNLDLPWEPAILNFHSSNRTVHTNSQSQVRKRLSTKSIGSWRRYADSLMKPVVLKLKEELERLRKSKSLPFAKTMNWNLDPDFPYPDPWPPITVEPSESVIATQISKLASLSLGEDSHGYSKDINSKLRPKVIKKSSLASDDNDDCYCYTESVSIYPEYDCNNADERNACPAIAAQTNNIVENVTYIYNQAGDIESRKVITSTANISSKVTSLVQNSSNLGAKQESVDASPSTKISDDITVKGPSIVDVLKEFKKKRELAISKLYSKYRQMAITAGALPSFPNPNVYSNDARLNDMMTFVSLFAGTDKNKVAMSLCMEIENVIMQKFSHQYKNNDTKPFGLIVFRRSNAKANRVAILSSDVDTACKLMERLSLSKFVIPGNNPTHLKQAIEYLNDALAMKPNDNYNVREARARALLKMGDHERALADINHAIRESKKPSKSVLLERGRIYHAMELYNKSLSDLHTALKSDFGDSALDPGVVETVDSRIWHTIGKCEKELGTHHSTMTAYNKSLQIKFDPGVLLDRGWVQIEFGQGSASLEDLNKVIKLEPQASLAYGYRGMLMHATGKHADAIHNFKRSLELGDGSDKQCYLFMAVCYQALGDFRSAKYTYDRLLTMDSKHIGWYQREYMFYTALRYDDPFASYNLDKELKVIVKEGFAWKSATFAIPTDKSYSSYSKKVASKIETSFYNTKFSDEKVDLWTRLLQDTEIYSDWIQLDCLGFLQNKRQHRMFGLAVLQVAQTLRRHIDIIMSGGLGLAVPDSQTSKTKFAQFHSCTKYGKSDRRVSSCPKGHHIYGWRDLFDTIVRWRQISEPNDSVFWLDCLSSNTYTGLNTYMIKGSTKVVRYHTYYDAAINMSKRVIFNHGVYNAKDKLVTIPAGSKEFDSANSVETLASLVGMDAFYVVVPCKSVRQKNLILNGTRVTAMKSGKGWDYSICSASTSNRFEQYEAEMSFTFSRLVQAILDYHLATENNMSEQLLREEKQDVWQYTMDLFYYWINFSPLSRGTSAVGYIALYASLMAAGLEPKNRVPRNVQLDWEALLESDPREFSAKMKNFRLGDSDLKKSTSTLLASTAINHPVHAHITVKLAKGDQFESLQGTYEGEGTPPYSSVRVDEVISTLRDMVGILSLSYED